VRTDHILGRIDNTLDDWGVSGDAMRWAPDAAGESAEPPPLTVVITVDTTRAVEAFDRIRDMRESMRSWAEAARPQLKEVGRSLAKMGEAAQLQTCDVHCKPPRPRDRPAWQSPYGPASRRTR
jgi:hypothetical protein